MPEGVVVRTFIPDEGEGGSPVLVVPPAPEVPPESMGSIAAAAGDLLTAFVTAGNRAEVRIRSFAPAGELPLSGRGVVGAFHYLAETGRFGLEDGIRRITCETGSGLLNVDVNMDGGKPTKVVLTTARPEVVTPRLMVGEISPHLGVDRARIEKAGAALQIYSTGARHLIVPFAAREMLAEIDPRPSLAKFLEAKKVQSLVSYAVVQTRPLLRIALRSFSPHLGIPESPASGTGASSLAGYLLANHIVPGTAPVTSIRMEQGAELGARSSLVTDAHVDPVMGGFRPTKIKVGGRALTVERRAVGV